MEWITIYSSEVKSQKSFLSLWSFPIFSGPWCLIQVFNCWEKFIPLRGVWVDKRYTGMRQGRKRDVFLFMWWKEGWTILSLNLSHVFLNLGSSYEPLSSEYCGWDTPNEARKTCEKGTWPLTYNKLRFQ